MSDPLSDPFCVLYKEAAHGRPRVRLSAMYDSIELAILAAFQLLKRDAMPLQLRGADGTVIEKAQLEELLDRVQASA